MEELREKLRYRLTPRNEWHKGYFDGVTGLVASRGEALGADSWEEIKEIACHLGKPDDLEIWDPTKRRFGCMLAVPMTIGGETIGVLKVENEEGRTFDRIDEEVLHILASLFTLAIGHELLDRSSGHPTHIASRGGPGVDFRELAKDWDRSDMAGVITGTPAQVTYAISDADFPALDGMIFEKAVVIGVGGSALPVDVLNDAFEARLRGPVVIRRYYELPAWVDDQTLVVLSSFSGNTEETLTPIWSNELARNARNVVVMTAGGELAKLASDRKYPMIRIPKELEVASFQPRCATGYFVTYLARLLTHVGLLEDSVTELEDLPVFLEKQNFRADGESMAWWLRDRHPVFYTDQSYGRSVGRIAKIKFNENAKRPAFFNALPEANHNEMIGFTRPKDRFGFLYLRDPEGLDSIDERFEVMKSLLADKGYQNIAFRVWDMPGIGRLQKIFSALAFADWVAYSAALVDHIDPTPVDLVETFKKLLRDRRNQSLHGSSALVGRESSLSTRGNT